MKIWLKTMLVLFILSLVYGAFRWTMESNNLELSQEQKHHSSHAFSMQSCRECHHNSPTWHSQNFLKEHGKHVKPNDNKCYTCHTRNTCISCHEQRPSSHNHNFLYKHHNLAQDNARSCLTCHQNTVTRDCIGCHQISEAKDWFLNAENLCQF
ncbi:MAG: hypothetical protein H3C47_11875 [Candidatus Cloacimonetes bacterium]|nr:hypothetical protein [Candidatus Cloacimonadota bacterium]